MEPFFAFCTGLAVFGIAPQPQQIISVQGYRAFSPSGKSILGEKLVAMGLSSLLVPRYFWRDTVSRGHEYFSPVLGKCLIFDLPF